jgi:formylglycine-generating enzyme required for sulfatase activity
VNVGDDVSLLTPGYYHADTSELIQMLQRGHQGVELDPEAWDRLVTWIDLNGPCHGTWRDVFASPIPGGTDQQRADYFRRYGGPADDPEWIPPVAKYDRTPVEPGELPPGREVTCDGWPFDGAAKRGSQQDASVRQLDLGGGMAMPVVRIPPGRFVMGSCQGRTDEVPEAIVEIEDAFWMGVCEVSNAQLRRCFPGHDSGHYTKRHKDRYDDKGMVLNAPSQPALKVSWEEAMAFCVWLSKRTGLDVSLPSEAQWEYACRAGSDTPFHYGDADTDFGRFENLADLTFASRGFTGKSLTGQFEIEGGVDYLIAEGVGLAERRFDDGWCMSADVGGRQPNAFGVADMHGNVAEWTLSLYRGYPYRTDDGRNDTSAAGKRVVRGGSFLDRPDRSRAAVRYGFSPWHKVYNVGFRVVVNQPELVSGTPAVTQIDRSAP